MAKASKNKKNTTEQEIEPVIDTNVPTESVIEAPQEVQAQVAEPIIEEAETPAVDIIEELPTDIKVSETVEQEPPVVEITEQPIIEPTPEPVAESITTEQVVEVVPEPIVEQIIEPVVESVIEVAQESVSTNIPEILPTRVGKLTVTETFLKSTPTFFTWLHKQGYAILSRNSSKNGDTTFVIEGHSLDAVIGEPPAYSVTAGNRLHIVRK